MRTDLTAVIPNHSDGTEICRGSGGRAPAIEEETPGSPVVLVRCPACQLMLYGYWPLSVGKRG